MGVYALFLTSSNFVAPLIAGFINDGQGWQWVLVSASTWTGIGVYGDVDSFEPIVLVRYILWHRIRYLLFPDGRDELYSTTTITRRGR